MHEMADQIPYQQNLVARLCLGGETVRHRLDGAAARLDFPILHDLKTRGVTEYFGLPVKSAYGSSAHMASYSTDRAGGFSDDEIAELTRVSGRLSVVADMHSQRQIAENVLKAYLGPLTGPRVLAGQIRRGTIGVASNPDANGFHLEE